MHIILRKRNQLCSETVVVPLLFFCRMSSFSQSTISVRMNGRACHLNLKPMRLMGLDLSSIIGRI
jgi:hypothetical protein